MADKPEKPYPGFPLYAHAKGYWAKTINSKTHYFGRWDEGWQHALQRYNKYRDTLHAGGSLSRATVTVRYACNLFMTAKSHAVSTGEIKQQTADEYEKTLRIVGQTIGPETPMESLTPHHFAQIRSALASRYGPTRLRREMTQTRMWVSYINDLGILPKPIRIGDQFKDPSSRERRLNRAARGEMMFEVDEIRTLLERSAGAMHCFILLGINCGFGNHDCGQLLRRLIDLKHGWITFPRPKTGVPRRAKIWRETIDALDSYSRPKPKHGTSADLVFITKYGRSWYKDTSDNPIANAFAKLMKSCSLHRPGRGFYALRHSFRTLAAETTDREAVDFVMGHVDGTMAGVYTERVGDDRLERIADHLHRVVYGTNQENDRNSGGDDIDHMSFL